jgi:hypothetical protein
VVCNGPFCTITGDLLYFHIDIYNVGILNFSVKNAFLP